MKGYKLLISIITAIILGIIIGSFANEFTIRLFATFNGLFGNFLTFIIPLIIFGFITPGIGSLDRGAGKLLGGTAGLAYLSTIIAGFAAFFIAKAIYPTILSGNSAESFANPQDGLATAFFTVEMPPPMEVITALILAFVIGIGISAIQSERLLAIAIDFRTIIELVIKKIIIPLLPFHIFGLFANMTYTGQVAAILNVFIKVFVMIIILHLLYLLFQYTIAGGLKKQNPLKMLKTMAPAYFTALGTQSSAAAIPITLKHTKKAGAKASIADFTVPLLANIHIAGSTITIVGCSLAIMFLQGQPASFSLFTQFILMLGITMVAAPGVPGGAVMAAIGIVESILGFGPTMVSLMIALYIAQDSLGTATNVTGDGAITCIIDSFDNRFGLSKKSDTEQTAD